MTARVADIIHHAALLSNATVEQLLGPTRRRGIARIRQAVMLVAVEANHSTPTIGRMLNRDHSTVIHGARAAANFAEREPEYGAFVNRLRDASREGGIFAADKYAYRPHVPPPRYAPTFRFKLPSPKLDVVREPMSAAGIYFTVDADGYDDNDHYMRADLARGSKRLADAIALARAA